MKGIKLLLALIFATWSLSLSAQNVLPTLKDNQTAQTIIKNEINYLTIALKTNPSGEIESKLDLYQLALINLNEPTQIKPTTEYAITSAFINHEVKWNNLIDTEALMKYRRKQWSKEFLDLLNLLKI
jgi:hypothetical protein